MDPWTRQRQMLLPRASTMTKNLHPFWELLCTNSCSGTLPHPNSSLPAIAISMGSAKTAIADVAIVIQRIRRVNVETVSSNRYFWTISTRRSSTLDRCSTRNPQGFNYCINETCLKEDLKARSWLAPDRNPARTRSTSVSVDPVRSNLPEGWG